MTEKPAKIDLNLVRRELGILVPYRKPPLKQDLSFIGLGILFAWTMIYFVIGEETIKQALRSLGLLH